MATKVLNKVMGFLGLEEENSDIDEVEYLEEEEESQIEQPVISSSKKHGKVVNIHTVIAAKVMIIKPRDYEEATYICDNLKNRKIIIVNSCEMEPKVAQRLLDFMGGASYALGGDLQEIEKGVYMLSPSNVEVTNELKNELSSKGMFNWTK